jgi:hypothetical protein
MPPVQMPSREPRPPREGLEDYCRDLAAYVSWERTYGDDAPRFGLTYRDKADGLLAAARRLAAHQSLSGDAVLAQHIQALGGLVEQPVTGARYNRDVIAAGHDVAERAEDVLGIAWREPTGPDAVEVVPPER